MIAPKQQPDTRLPENMEVFHETLQKHFPGTLEMKDYMSKTSTCLNPYGFKHENTMGMVAICRDEITYPLYEEVVKYWGKTFNCSSLAGFVTMGTTGLGAATGHTPLVDGIGRFTFYAMPHIAISIDGVIGNVQREGREKVSHACGALDAIVGELNSGCLKMKTDMGDIEQSILRQKILSDLKYGEKLDLVGITKLACQIVSKDVEQLLSNLDKSKFKFAVMTGIQIHGPMDTNWIWPQDFYVFDFVQKKLELL